MSTERFAITGVHHFREHFASSATHEFIMFFFEWNEAESTRYVVHYLVYCASPGLWLIMSVEQSTEWELPGETEVLVENLS
jgi:hypothetical protein